MKPRLLCLMLTGWLLSCVSPPPAVNSDAEGVVTVGRQGKSGGGDGSASSTSGAPGAGASGGTQWGSFRPSPIVSGLIPTTTESTGPLSQVNPFFDFDFRGPSGMWTVKPALNRGRAGLQAGVVDDVLIAVEGEHRPSMEAFGRTDRQAPSWVLNDNYDEKGTSGSGDRLGYGLWLSAGGVFNNNELWTAGGFRGDFNPDGGSGRTELLRYQVSGFSQGRPDGGSYNLSRPRRAPAGGVLDHVFVVAGGVYEASAGALPRVDLIDLLKTGPDAVQTGPNLPTPVAGAASAVVDKRLYVLGGYDPRTPNQALKQVQIYDLAANNWTTGVDLPEGRHSAAATANNGVIYLVGGVSEGGTPQKTFWSFNTQRKDAKWERLPDLPTARALLALVAHRGELWAIGGIGASRTALPIVEGYRL